MSVEIEDAADASSGDDASALAKKLQNPIGDLYSFPFQNNTNFNTSRTTILARGGTSAALPSSRRTGSRPATMPGHCQ